MSVRNETTSEIAQTEKFGLGDLVIAGVIALITGGLLVTWEFPGLYPGLWKDATIASFVRPATTIAPGYWMCFSTLLFKFAGIDTGLMLLRVFGHLSLVAIAICIYAVLREWLALAMRMRPQLSRRRTIVMQLASALGAAAFISADPVWTAGQCFTPTTVLLGMTLGALEFFFVFLRKGDLKYAYICSLILGALSAETPLGLILATIFISVYLFIIKVMPSLESPFFEPAVMEVGKWHMTFIFMAAFIFGIALNCGLFVVHGGVGAVGETIGSIPLHYLIDYWNRLASAGSPSAWLLWSGVCIMPFVVTTIKFPESADEEQFLSYASGLIFLFCGTVAFSQSAFIPALWFWTYYPMDSQYLLTMGIFCCSATLALAMTILGVDALCRNHKRLATQFFGDPREEENLEDEDEYAPRRRRCSGEVKITAATTFLRRFGILAVPAFLLLMLLPGRVKSTTREMLTVLQDSIRAFVSEAGDAKFCFTDGNLDEALELESARRGGSLKCYSLMGGEGAMDAYLRTRNVTDNEDLLSFRFDTGTGLRTWIRDKPERLKDCAVLMGFDLWKRDGKALPPMGGLLSRPAGFPSEDVRLAGIDTAYRLADRVLAIHRLRGGITACTDLSIKDKFLAVQWRLARMCIYRSETDDLLGKVDQAVAEVTRAKALNDKNAIYQDLVTVTEKTTEMLMQKLTPREGLQLALVRADFTMAKIYAETILAAEPNNPDACFGMGMYYLREHQFSRAEAYLKRCLIFKPNEPAVYNNLAMIEIERGRFDAARVNIDKALKLLPRSAAIRDTERKLQEAIKNASR